MHIVLLDWTRMGRSYCVAGAMLEDDLASVVRPLPWRGGDTPVRNVGWSPFLLDGHRRWDVFECVHPYPASIEPPHTEDVWVRDLKPLRRSATPAERRQILAASCPPDNQPLFGSELCVTRASAYLPPLSGVRSLATVHVAAEALRFSGTTRAEAAEPEVRVELPLPGLASKLLPVKDHHLLKLFENDGRPVTQLAAAIQQVVLATGPRVAVRLGLTRPFQATPGRGPGFCWLMADGFFSLADPQP